MYIGRDLLRDPELLASHVPGSQVVIVSNETVAPIYLERVRAALGERSLVSEVILPDGEQYKSLATLEKIFDQVMTDRHSRTTTMIALGGGVVGDITGFAAACYQRGVRFVQLPTTLLAQVDSSVGGKTAVNHPLGKNMIGAFYQPQAVLIDTNTLQTLPPREFAAGMAEVVKYGLICDEPFYRWLQAAYAQAARPGGVRSGRGDRAQLRQQGPGGGRRRARGRACGRSSISATPSAMPSRPHTGYGQVAARGGSGRRHGAGHPTFRRSRGWIDPAGG